MPAAPARTPARPWRRLAAVAGWSILALAATPCSAAPDAAAPAASAEAAQPHPLARRMLACTPCHGAQGRASNTGYRPRIAGKPAGYLFNQLVHFREGRRHNPSMARLVEHMSDDYLREIAAYFASLELPYPPAQTATLTPAQRQLAERLVREGDAARELPACERCHGRRLTGIQPAVPGLVGLPRDYLLGQFGAWRNGLRRAAPPDCMAVIAQRLQPQEIEALTLWISAQPTAGDMASAPASALPRPWPMACGSGAG